MSEQTDLLERHIDALQAENKESRMKAERREITFRRVSKNCTHRMAGRFANFCSHEHNISTREWGLCCAESCPIWKRLKKVKEE